MRHSAQVATLASVLVLTALAWAYLIHLDGRMSESMAYEQSMAEMGMSTDASLTGADVLFAFGMWSVMMVGMMSPSAAPILIVHSRSAAARGERPAFLSTLIFAAGYFVVWIGFSAVAACAQWWLDAAQLLSASMAAQSTRIGGAILLSAGLYQLTPIKRSCMVHCQSPMDFLMAHWRPGRFGAFRMGVHHGAYCLGCCWALMAVLFAVGIMNLVWVAAIGVFVLLEKTSRAGVIVSRVAAAGLIVMGADLLLRS